MQNNSRYTQFHITNPLPDQDHVQNVFGSLVREYKEFRINVPVGCVTDRCSKRSKERTDLSMFSGSAGYLYLYLRMHEFVTTLPEDIAQNCTSGLSDCELPEFFSGDTYLELALKQFQALQQIIKPSKDISFLISSSAINLMGADLFYIMKEKESFQKCIQEVLSHFAGIVASPLLYQQELLYGIPGYVYMFLWLHKKYSKAEGPYQLDLTSHLHTLCKILIQIGGQGILKFKFYEKTYLGGAHGVLGVIQMLLLCYQYCKDYFHLKDEQGTLQMLQSIQQTLDYVLKIYYMKGNIPSSMENLDNLKFFQFCHGIPGAVAPFLLAYQIFNKQDYLDGAIHMSENIYQYGMIKKGYGICHGIPGNSYAFMQIYNITKNEKMRKYAYQFLQYKQNPHVYNDVKNFPFQDRYNVGLSDNPYSLMLGSVGDMCAMMDFINYKRMPAYEI